MDGYRFIDMAKEAIAENWNETAGAFYGKEIKARNVLVVWYCKTLQNHKALLTTDIWGDGLYYEATYNGDAEELYLDEYKKTHNQVIKA